MPAPETAAQSSSTESRGASVNDLRSCRRIMSSVSKSNGSVPVVSSTSWDACTPYAVDTGSFSEMGGQREERGSEERVRLALVTYHHQRNKRITQNGRTIAWWKYHVGTVFYLAMTNHKYALLHSAILSYSYIYWLVSSSRAILTYKLTRTNCK